MSVGLWVTLIVVLFVIGNVMGVKPRQADIRLDQLRMLARQHGFLPKLAKAPTWLTNHSQKPLPNPPLLSQYALVVDEITLPLLLYVNHQGVWQLCQQELSQQDLSFDKHSSNKNFAQNPKLPDTLPLMAFITPYAYGLVLKANSIVLLWNDEQYSLKYSDTQKNDEHIQSLKAYLTALAHQASSA